MHLCWCCAAKPSHDNYFCQVIPLYHLKIVEHISNDLNQHEMDDNTLIITDKKEKKQQ